MHRIVTVFISRTLQLHSACLYRYAQRDRHNTSNATENQVTCIFHEGLLAIGCLIVLTSMVKEITYFIAQQRDYNASASDFPIFQSCKAILFDAGRYLLHVYDIERD